ncbi:Thioesterase/thiol ester dehydrase-isomerase [Sarocladium strictum]
MTSNQQKPAESAESDSISLIEAVGEVKATTQADVFVNKQPLWLPPDARGIYGGIYLAQCLQATQKTVPNDFLIHSMQCRFVAAGKPESPLEHLVERISDGRNFSTRVVKTKQDEKTVFLASLSFARLGKAEDNVLSHAEPFPEGIPEPRDGPVDQILSSAPYVNKKVGLTNADAKDPSRRKAHQWFRASQKLSPSASIASHLSAVAYISDCYMVGLLPHIHGIWDFFRPPLTEFDADGEVLADRSEAHVRIRGSGENLEGPANGRRVVGMMVTLSHTMLFFSPEDTKADEWMLSELESHWTGQGRGSITQKIWSKNGKLLAFCTQEGIVRLQKEEKRKEGSRL